MPLEWSMVDKDASAGRIAENRRARYDYFIEERFEAGVALQGWEVKALRAGRLQLQESYVLLKDDEAWLFGAHVSPLPTASTNAGQTDFTKIEGTFARTQPLFAGISAFFAAYGQYAFTPLLVSEQCSYGGRFFGRAYDPSQLLGDRCWEVLGEVRYDITTPWKQLTRLQPYAFADHGEVHTILPAIGTLASAKGTSVGGGVRAAWEDTYTADLSVAQALEGPRHDLRAFVILGAKY